MDLPAAQAFIRFGMGRRGDEPLPADPAAWLVAQVRQPDPARINCDPPPSASAALEALRFDRVEKPPQDQRRAHLFYPTIGRAELDNAITTPAPFRERLVWFWSNHFTVSVTGGNGGALLGPFVEEAIRPHVTGKFDDMLLAVMQHPQMLFYLANAVSIGPDSPDGRAHHRGLNENLGRECLELYTVSPASGYTQQDVTAFARILTGWGIIDTGDRPGFIYRAAWHEPGSQILLGQTFPPGEEGGVAALHFLASHPSTHHFLATKLVRHFVADDPPPDAVRQIEGVLRDTHGDLGAAAAALPALPAAWQPATKLRTPQDLVIAALRALDLPPEQRDKLNAMAMLAGLGQQLWAAPQPNGWPDRAGDWTAPEAMMRRIDWAFTLSGRIGPQDNSRDVAEIADASLGPLLRAETLTAIRQAGSRREALTLLLNAAEFQRR